MTNDRWQQIADLFTAALAQPPDVRQEFVRNKAAADTDLRNQVESLLASDGHSMLLDESLAGRSVALLVDNPHVRPGDVVGSYRIDTLLGAGGMGEVYRAHDMRLNRDVALKILPFAFATDADRLARFKREAQVLAALNHPNISNIYGFEEANGVHALILELVEGPTLAELLASKRAASRAIDGLPVEEAMHIARQIADALEAAHEQGIVHRDLKPANIKVKDDGTVKVLDFGLAKIADAAVQNSTTAQVITQSPTITTPAMTAAGMILGTAAYMSPEQARGKPADKRSDIWAFGCVLYEMLTGTRAFEGEDVAETLAEVIKGSPDWSRVSDVPSSVKTLLRGCLEKDRRKRIGDASVIRFAANADDDSAAQAQTRPRPSRMLSAVSVVVAAAAVALTAWTVTRRSPAPAPTVTRLEMTIAPAARFTGQGRHVAAISPDGAYVAYAADEQLYLRRLDQLTAVAVRGSGGSAFAREPFFSPDSQWLGFWHDGALKRVSVNGGTPTIIAKAENPWGASWGADGTIVFGQGVGGVWRVDAEGGEATQLIKMEPGRVAHGPQMLPGGKAVLFTLLDAASSGWEDAQLVVRTLNDGVTHVLTRGGADARYLPTGQLVYVADDALLVAPLNTASWSLGEVITRVNGVARAPNGQTAVAHYGVSDTGSLIYVPGTFRVVPMSVPTWIDHDGKEESLGVEPHQFLYPRLSPSGDRLVMSIRDQFEALWSWDFRRRTLERVTNTGIRENYPVWTPDGQHIIFSVSRGGNADVWMQRADGSGGAIALTQSLSAELGNSITPDGTRLIFQDPNNGTISMLDLSKDHRVTPLLHGRFIYRNAEVAPDGKWLAYDSNESGGFEVYVRPFPAVDGFRVPISSGGGVQPLWSRDMRSLYFMRPAGGLMRVPVTFADGAVKAGTPELWANIPRDSLLPSAGISARLYDQSPDGKRFLHLRRVSQEDQVRAPSSIVVVQHWDTEVARAAAEPSKR